MIYEDERTVDELVDDILNPEEDEGVREPETPSANGKRVYLNRCRDCRATFETPYVGGKYCPACKRKRISEGQKARQAREHAAAEPVGPSRTGPTGAIGRQETDGSRNDVQEAWDALGAPEDTSSVTADAVPPSPEGEGLKDPADMETDELLRVMADGMRRDAGDVILSLYETIRSMARAGGMEPGRIVQALYEMDCVLERVAKV